LIRELGSKRSIRDIKYVSTPLNRGIFAVIVRSYGYSKRIFRIGRHNKEKRKNVA
jgi:hypothetical protein